MMTTVYRLILIAAILLIVLQMIKEKEFKFQVNAAWVLIPFILRALMLVWHLSSPLDWLTVSSSKPGTGT